MNFSQPGWPCQQFGPLPQRYPERGNEARFRPAGAGRREGCTHPQTAAGCRNHRCHHQSGQALRRSKTSRWPLRNPRHGVSWAGSARAAARRDMDFSGTLCKKNTQHGLSQASTTCRRPRRRATAPMRLALKSSAASIQRSGFASSNSAARSNGPLMQRQTAGPMKMARPSILLISCQRNA